MGVGRPMPKFKVGDLVKLKSSSPVMTVNHVVVATKVYVDTTWFAGAKHNTARFEEGALELAPPNAAAPASTQKK